MVDTTKTEQAIKEKPPTQTASVKGIDAFKPMGADKVDWARLVNLPAFEMFVNEQSKLTDKTAMNDWVTSRLSAIGDAELYSLYVKWFEEKGYWKGETPMGYLESEQ